MNYIHSGNLLTKKLMDLTRKGIWLVAGVLWLFLFAAGVQSYEGNPSVYIAFSIVFLLLLVSAFHRQRTYVYTYLVSFLWLGYWLKVSYHLAFPYPFVEPVGRFSGSATDWNEALLVPTVAATGILISRGIFSRLAGERQSILAIEKKCLPRWLCTYDRWHLAAFLSALVAVTLANVYYGIFVVGFDVRTILIWPLNALITLMLVGGGFVVWAASILWWRLASGRPIFLLLVLLLVSGVIITFSTLSRGLVVFFVLPLLYALYKNRKEAVDYSKPRLMLIGMLFFVTVVSSFFIINVIRNNVYFDEHRLGQTGTQSDHQSQTQSQTMVQSRAFLHFSIDRWVGIEGVMAVSSYPGNSGHLLVRAILETPSKGDPSIYQKICPWPVSQQFSTLKKDVSLFSLPGGIAFLYYSGSIAFVFVSAALISLLLQYAESVIFRFTGNPILCSGMGWLMAISFAHFGGAPRYEIPVIVFLFVSICLVAVIQSKRTEYLFGMASRP